MRIVQFSTPVTRSLGPSFGFASRSPWTWIENELDRFFNSALTSLADAPQSGRFPVDLYEDKENTYLRAELPGIKKEDINIEVVDGFLTLQATRKEKQGDAEKSYALSRSVMLQDEVQADKISASYENGILTVTIPKREASKPRKITVSVN